MSVTATSTPARSSTGKSPSDQLNSYADVTGVHRSAGTTGDPFELLDGLYPDEALEEMAVHYGSAGR